MADNKKYRRVETGPLQFGDDWPGVFFRGDSAGWYGFCLKNILDQIEQGKLNMDTGTFCALRSLENTLTGCDTRTLNQADLVLAKDFADCLLQEEEEEKTAETPTANENHGIVKIS